MSAAAAIAPAEPDLVVEAGADTTRVRLRGGWTADRAEAIERLLAQRLDAATMPHIVLDFTEVERLDTVAAWILDRLRAEWAARGMQLDFAGTRPEHATLLAQVAAHGFHRPRPKRPRRLDLLVDLGQATVGIGRDLGRGMSFFGEVVLAISRVASWRRHFRFAAFVHQVELIGLRGAPIIILISFLVGCIVAQQGVLQLRRFGAEPFVVDLIGILSLRELGLLLTAIMVAGRSGSSFTAELGSMKMREEIDALKVMGFDPVEVLIIPRLFALILALPMLTFVADMAALYGGGVTAWLYGDISPDAFLQRLRNAIGLNTFLVGIIKAPFMAAIIGVIAAIEGFAVEGSAESLGRHVTASVVKAIFMVIVVDGLFAMFFAAIRY